MKTGKRNKLLDKDQLIMLEEKICYNLHTITLIAFTNNIF